MFRIYSKTHPGNRRELNEDAILADAQGGLVAVADGMGGYAAGEVASAIVTATLTELNPNKDELIAALVECHRRIVVHAQAHPETQGMGSTAVLAKLGPNQVTVCWTGDSRLYLVNREKGLVPVSRDHSKVEWLLFCGEITPEQARTHPERNVVTQCLGIYPPQPERITVDWQQGDRVLLCSDGLTDELDDPEIAKIVAEAPSSEEALERLVQAALEAGGKDNVTVVIAENDGGQNGQKQKTRNKKEIALLANAGIKTWQAVLLAGLWLILIGILFFLKQ
jgi:PPM family protein phosphatase